MKKSMIHPSYFFNIKSITLSLLLMFLPASYALSQTEFLSFTQKFEKEHRVNIPLEINPFSYSYAAKDAANISSTSGGPSFNLFGNFGNNILNSFKGDNLYLHLSAVAATYLLVSQNVDYHVEDFFNKHEEYGRWARPVVISGELLPFVVGGSLFSYAKIKNDNQVLGASFAVLQASLIEFLYNSTLKAITGRAHPDWRHNSDMKSLSKTFHFGFLRGGIFWGWPSGHTAATMAVVSALTNYYPNSTWLKIAGYGLVAYTMFGVSSFNRGGMHWFSDAVAGALMSYAVGSTVGKYYRNVYNSGTGGTAAGKTVVTPEINPLGINLTFSF